MFQFIEVGIEKDTSSDDEGTGDEAHISDEFAETNIKDFDSLKLLEQVVSPQDISSCVKCSFHDLKVISRFRF